MAYISFQPSDFFNTVLYTGTGATHSVTGVGFQPDLSWVKDRTAVAYHYLFDSARGVGKAIFPNDTDEEAYNLDYMSAFNADGITLGTNTMVNGNTKSYVSWHWKAGTTTALSGGTITPTSQSINTTTGISIVTYTGNGSAGATIPHGLGATPQTIIVKNLNDAGTPRAWAVYCEGAGNTKYMALNSTQAFATSSTRWNDTSPTSTLFSVGTTAETNVSGDLYVAYLFTPIKGYSCFSNWTGAGGTHPFMYCGFEPAFVIAKNMESAKSWLMYDNKRPGYNETNNYLEADDTGAESTGNACDFTSQGFKVRVTTGGLNAAGAPTFFMAFAAKPFVSSNSIPNTAR